MLNQKAKEWTATKSCDPIFDAPPWQRCLQAISSRGWHVRGSRAPDDVSKPIKSANLAQVLARVAMARSS